MDVLLYFLRESHRAVSLLSSHSSRMGSQQASFLHCPLPAWSISLPVSKAAHEKELVSLLYMLCLKRSLCMCVECFIRDDSS